MIELNEISAASVANSGITHTTGLCDYSNVPTPIFINPPINPTPEIHENEDQDSDDTNYGDAVEEITTESDNQGSNDEDSYNDNRNDKEIIAEEEEDTV